ncbi:hypothetical protein HMPREF1487_07450 [Pseudomonas sp. HPB0071]|uniref:DUF72 domain-containing protein n=1 Tax=unclassified Pseudomonas TaxID=196821 RepID=UPI0002C8CA63|nr:MULTISPECIES: DUF72 domain-containing protein [unclassified Pseudomonas]ENA32017.1 hypothetical protein HMPREF1487_07450 [Pseudomonas sp. HPB0071]
MLPYYIGCPSWSDPHWRGSLYPASTRSSEFLPRYAQVFNAVEGNTTFYAEPSGETVSRWAELMPDHFRFCAKFPREISHDGDLRACLSHAHSFMQLLVPLGRRVSPYWLQFSSNFGPNRLAELADFLDALPSSGRIAVEVRHDDFFSKGMAERELNNLLMARNVERIGLDSRALFSSEPVSDVIRDAQAKKPRVPVRVPAFTQSPQIRFIGRLELEANDIYLEPWVIKFAEWIKEGRTPYIFLHTPDNRHAPELAMRFHAQLQERLPELPPLPVMAEPVEQLGLL